MSDDVRWEWAIRQANGTLITEDWDDRPFTEEAACRAEQHGKVECGGTVVKRLVSAWVPA